MDKILISESQYAWNFICTSPDIFMAWFLSTGTALFTFLILNYNQQDATFLDLFIPTDALHAPDGSFSHHRG